MRTSIVIRDTPRAFRSNLVHGRVQETRSIVRPRRPGISTELHAHRNNSVQASPFGHPLWSSTSANESIGSMLGARISRGTRNDPVQHSWRVRPSDRYSLCRGRLQASPSWPHTSVSHRPVLKSSRTPSVGSCNIHTLGLIIERHARGSAHRTECAIQIGAFFRWHTNRRASTHGRKNTCYRMGSHPRSEPQSDRHGA